MSDYKIKPSHTMMTRGVNERVIKSTQFASFCSQSLNRHLSGDWGDVPEQDKKQNDASLKDGSRVLSSYSMASEKIWIISDAEDERGERITTILFPEEY